MIGCQTLMPFFLRQVWRRLPPQPQYKDTAFFFNGNGIFILNA